MVEEAERIERSVSSEGRALAELEEAYVKATYGPFRYSRDAAEALVKAAQKVVDLLTAI